MRCGGAANRSLNRTLHSVPAFGLAFHASPNAVPLFLGRLASTLERFKEGRTNAEVPRSTFICGRGPSVR